VNKLKTRHFIYTGAALLIFFALVIVHFLNEPSNPTVPSESIEASPNPTSTAAADLQTQPNDLPKFTYESNYDEIPYIDDNALRFIMDAYAATDELECVFETGDESLYPLFKEKFRKLLLLEEQVYDKETGQYLYVNEIGEFKDYKFNTGIINPNDSGYTVYDLKFFFFDINGDNMPELVIYNNRVKLIVGYDINYDLLYIWEYYAARSPVILGTRKNLLVWNALAFC
jgi:hypothetical protein